MIDPYILLAPIFLLPMVALLRFIGCASFGSASVDPVTTPTITISTVPSGGLGPGQTFQFEAKDSGGAVVTQDAVWATTNGAFDATKHGLYTAPNVFVPGTMATIHASYQAMGTVGSPATADANVSLSQVKVVIAEEAGVVISKVTPGQKFTLTVQVQGISDQTTNVMATTGVVSPNPGGGYTYQAPSPFMLARQSDIITASSKAAPGAAPANKPIGLTSGNRAEFKRVDTVTKGNWDSAPYGADGRALASLAPTPCTYFPGLAGALGPLGTPAPYTPDGLDPRDAKGSPNRVASDWFTPSDAIPLQISFAFNDFAFHRVALYCRDHDNQGRKQRFDFFDDATSPVAILTQSLDTFTQGKYLVVNLSGTVRLRITHIAGAGSNAVLSGIFFDPPEP